VKFVPSRPRQFFSSFSPSFLILEKNPPLSAFSFSPPYVPFAKVRPTPPQSPLARALTFPALRKLRDVLKVKSLFQGLPFPEHVPPPYLVVANNLWGRAVFRVPFFFPRNVI